MGLKNGLKSDTTLSDFTPYNPDEPVHRHRLHLPHWRQWERTYFVTTRLADSIPNPVRDEWLIQRNSWLTQRGILPGADPSALPEDERIEFHRKFTTRFHELLDAGHGECMLKQPALAAILTNLLTSGHESDYQLDAWVIMPNHLHALVTPNAGQTLGKVVQRWKGASARHINQMTGRSGSLWQAEAFDHIVRSEKQLQHFRRYIAQNPPTAALRESYILGRGNRSGITAEEAAK